MCVREGGEDERDSPTTPPTRAKPAVPTFPTAVTPELTTKERKERERGGERRERLVGHQPFSDRKGETKNFMGRRPKLLAFCLITYSILPWWNSVCPTNIASVNLVMGLL